MKVHNLTFRRCNFVTASDTKKTARQSLDRVFTLILILKSASNFTPTALNRTRKKGTVNHLIQPRIPAVTCNERSHIIIYMWHVIITFCGFKILHFALLETRCERVRVCARDGNHLEIP